MHDADSSRSSSSVPTDCTFSFQRMPDATGIDVVYDRCNERVLGIADVNGCFVG